MSNKTDLQELNSNLSNNNTNLSSILTSVQNLVVPSYQAKTVTPTASQQVVTPDSGKTALSSVTINGDSNLKAQNVKKDVVVFGVTGTLESGGSGTGLGIIINEMNNTVNKPSNITIATGNLSNALFYNVNTGAGYWTNVETLTNFDNWNLGNTIPINCFCCCNALTFSCLPTAVTNYANYCFQVCRNLQCAPWTGSTSINIGNYAFSYCDKLTWQIVNTCNRVNSYAFNGCTSLGPKMKIKAKYISRNMFQGCTGITKVWIASTCTNLFGTTSATTGPFNGCTALTDIYVEATAKPSNFNSYWGYVNASCQPTIHYSTTESAFDALS